jgi:hypothetical protein
MQLVIEFCAERRVAMCLGPKNYTEYGKQQMSKYTVAFTLQAVCKVAKVQDRLLYWLPSAEPPMLL